MRDPYLEAVGDADPAPHESESEFNLSEYVEVLRRHWRLVAVVAAIGLSAGALHFSITPKEYQARTRIQIERRTLSALAGADNMYLDASWWNPEFYPTQYELLRSRGLAERVVRDLDLVSDPDFNPAAASRGSDEETLASDDDAVIGSLASRLRGALAVEPVKQTQLVDLIVRWDDPRKAALFANAFADSFKDQGIADRKDTATRAGEFLDRQIRKLRREIDDKESELQKYSRQSDIIALDPDSNVTLKRLEAVNNDYIQARSKRIEKEVRYKELMSAPKATVADTLSDGLVSTLRSEQLKLERQYATNLKTYKPDWPAMVELQAQIEKGRQNLDKVIDEMVAQARQTARAEYQTALSNEKRLQEELEEIKAETLNLNSKAVEYNNLKVEISTRRQLVDELLRRQSETNVALEGSSESTVTIVERALVPGGPFRPNLQKDLTMGGGLGMMIGIGLVFLLEFLDRTIKTPEEIEKRLRIPTLAVIPDTEGASKRYGYLARYGYGYGHSYAYGYGARRSKGARNKSRKPKADADGTAIELLPQLKPRLAVSEAYRSLRTALLLSSAQEPRVIVVTSATAGEGKTATSSNLSTVLAQLGRRVLLIDADLRKPRIHQVLKVSNRTGVVNYLIGRAEVSDVILKSSVPNLAVIPAGPLPPNPSELLSTERMSLLLNTVRSQFDFVVIDSPPTLPVTDAALIGNIADGVVLCLAAGRVTREDARSCKERLEMAGVKLLGAVLNRYRPLMKGHEKNYYYHYEAYGEYAKTSRAGSAA